MGMRVVLGLAAALALVACSSDGDGDAGFRAGFVSVDPDGPERFTSSPDNVVAHPVPPR